MDESLIEKQNGNFANTVLGAVPSVVYNEDCVEGLKRFSDNHFDLAIVDPPYGIDLTKQQKEMNNSNKVINGGRWKAYKSHEWDLQIPNKEYFDELFRVSKNQIIWGANFMIEHLYSSKGFIIWNKIQRGQPASDGEIAWTSFNKPMRIFDYSRIDAYVNNIDVKIHPTQKPVKLYDWILEQYGSDANLILDTHVVSGSSRIACNKAGKQFVGFEIDKDYYEAQEKRFKDFVSQLRMF